MAEILKEISIYVMHIHTHTHKHARGNSFGNNFRILFGKIKKVLLIYISNK